jgi:hypothetical protein
VYRAAPVAANPDVIGALRLMGLGEASWGRGFGLRAQPSSFAPSRSRAAFMSVRATDFA